jgi:hypothetical protein
MLTVSGLLTFAQNKLCLELFLAFSVIGLYTQHKGIYYMTLRQRSSITASSLGRLALSSVTASSLGQLAVSSITASILGRLALTTVTASILGRLALSSITASILGRLALSSITASILGRLAQLNHCKYPGPAGCQLNHSK